MFGMQKKPGQIHTISQNDIIHFEVNSRSDYVLWLLHPIHVCYITEALNVRNILPFIIQLDICVKY